MLWISFYSTREPDSDALFISHLTSIARSMNISCNSNGDTTGKCKRALLELVRATPGHLALSKRVPYICKSKTGNKKTKPKTAFMVIKYIE